MAELGTRQSQVRINTTGTSLMVQCLGLGTSTAGGLGLISGQGTKIPQLCTAQRYWMASVVV